MTDKNNPYLQASAAYGSANAELNQRSLEGQLLLKSAFQLEELAKRLTQGEKVDFRESFEILEHNQKLWIIFVGDTMDESHPLPQNIKNNIASLGVFIFNRTKDLLINCTPEKIAVLININRNIASGLMKQGALNPAASGIPSSQAEAGQKKTETDDLI